MIPSANEIRIQHQFDSFCKKILKGEVRDYFREMKKQRDHEVSLSDLSEQELEQIGVTDEYFAVEEIFNVLGNVVVIKNEQIADALRNLPEQKRDIILLSYFLDMTDKEIGNKLNLIRATVQYQRTSTLQHLRKIMEEALKDEEYFNG